MFEGYITACMRSVTTNKEVVYRPVRVLARAELAALPALSDTEVVHEEGHLTLEGAARE